MDKINTTLQKKIIETSSLSDFPNGINHLLDAIFSDNIDYLDLTKAINKHPSIAMRLISLANSAWSAPVSPITTVEDACRRLGFTVIRNVSIALSVSAPFKPLNCAGFDIGRFWLSSMLVADVAGVIAASLENSPDHDEVIQTVQTAGIIHNIGLLWLADNMPKETSLAILSSQESEDLPLNQALLNEAETDYCEVSYLLGKQWKIPDALLVAMQHHLNSDYGDEHARVAHIIGAASIWVSAIIKNSEILPTNIYLEKLDIKQETQENIISTLDKKLARTKELASTLFGSY